MGMIRVVAVLTHPVQYFAGWFRAIHESCADLDLHVIYASRPGAEQQGVGFERPLTWDVPLTTGYDYTIVRDARPSDRFDAGHFWGLDVRQVGQAIADAKPDVVVVFGWYSVTLVRAIRAARRLGVPVIYYGDTNLQSAPGTWRHPLWVHKTRRLLRRFDTYLSVGVRSGAFLRFFGVPDSKIFATPHAVDNARFAPAAELRRSSARANIRAAFGLPQNGFVVLFAGKLEPKKHPLDVVAALGRLEPRGHFAVAGSGPLEGALSKAAATAGVPLSLLGFVNQQDMLRVYAAADCLVLPSDGRETWGLVVNEALASGLPCIVADSAGCAPDLATAETGGVYATADPVALPTALAGEIARVRASVERGHDFAPACQAAAARHSYAAAAEGLANACRAVVFRTHPPPGREPRVLACCGAMVLVGGLERMTFEILGTIRESGATVHCIVNWYDNQRIVALAERVGASWTTGRYLRRLTVRVGPIGLIRILIDILRTSSGLLRDAAYFRPSHVLVSDYLTVLRNAPALGALRLAGVPVILRLGNAPDQGNRYHVVWRFLINPLVNLFVSNSTFTDQELAVHGIAARKRLTIAHTPPSRRESAGDGARDRNRVVYVGQIIPGKGLEILLDAMGLLVARGHDVTLDVVGHDDGVVPEEYERFRAALRQRAGRDDLRGRVRFLGYRDDVPAILAAAAIHCCPSTRALREGFGIVVIEAKRAGIPSVVLPSGNLPNLVRHGENGWICRDETPEALAEGIEQFLDPDRLARAMAAARASAADFSRERFDEAWREVFLRSACADDVDARVAAR